MAPDAVRYRRALEGLLGVPATEGNSVEVLRNGDEIFPAMLEEIAAAQETIDFMTFVYWEGAIGRKMAEALCERANGGVRVRVLLDAVGAHTMDRDLVDAMAAAGAHVEWFRPLKKTRVRANNNRSHRKVLICDESVAFTGGVGIADEWCGNARGPGEWRDTHFRVRGPAVDGIRAAFVQNWGEMGRPLFETGRDRFPCQPESGSSVVQVIRGAAQTGWSDILTLTQALLLLATERVRITTAYFVPTDETCRILCDKARAGTDIEVLLPGPHTDKRFVQLASEDQYGTLLEAGVKVLAYQPTMLHAKVITIDSVVASVGSANFNNRSLALDDEVNLVVIDSDVVAELDAHFDEDRADAKELDPANWPDRALVQRAKETVAGLVRRAM